MIPKISPRFLIIALVALTALAPFVMYAQALPGAAEAGVPPFRALPPFEQIVLAGAVYPIKLTYMVLAAVAVALLWGQAAPARAALRWSMIFFLVGEIICWVNIIFFTEEHLLLEYLHSWGMVACLGFLAFAALEALDSGVFHYSAPAAKCALVGVCRHCAKYADVPCALERLFKWTLPLGILLVFMPLTAPIVPVRYDTLVFNVPRTLSHSIAVQMYEMRYAPWAGLLLMGAAWALMLWRGRHSGALALSKILLCAGLGHLAFAFMRLAFFAFYRDNLVWFVFWEEFTELILVAGVLVAVWLFIPELPARGWLRNADMSR